MVRYGIARELSCTFAEANEQVRKVFKEHGFGVISEIDVKETLHTKIGKEIEPYTILGMCNPHMAAKAIEMENEVGLLLPCNVLLREGGGAVHVSAQDPQVMLSVAGNPALRQLAEEAKRLIEAAMAEL